MAENIRHVFNASSKINQQLKAMQPCRSHAVPKLPSELNQLANDQKEMCEMKGSGMHAGLRKRRKVPAKLQMVSSV